MRKLSSAALLAVLAILTAVFSLGFFFGRRTVPYEISVSCSKAAAEVSPAAQQTQKEAASTEALQDEEPELIDLNTATKEDLMRLPRVGEVIAQRILDYRAQYGRFSAPEQLMDVEGIGEATFEGLKALVTVEDSK